MVDAFVGSGFEADSPALLTCSTMDRQHRRVLRLVAGADAPGSMAPVPADMSLSALNCRRTAITKCLRDNFCTQARDSEIDPDQERVFVPIGELSSDVSSCKSRVSETGDTRKRLKVDDCFTPRPIKQPRAVRSCPANGSSTLSNFILKSIIADGAFGTVWRAINKSNGQTVAIKRIRNDMCTAANFSLEVVAMEEMACAGVVKKLDHFAVTESAERCIVMEMAKGGDLFDRVEKCDGLSNCEAKILFRQIISAVATIHSRDWVHGDLKLENVFITETKTEVKLGDLGFSHQQCAGGKSHGMRGTVHYTAPEVVLQTNTAGYCGKAADCYACGVMLYIMLCGCYPNRPSSGSSPLTAGIASGLESLMFPPGIAAPAVSLIRWLMQPSPACRASVDEALQSSWIVGSDVSAVTPERPTSQTTATASDLAMSGLLSSSSSVMSGAPSSRSAVTAALLLPKTSVDMGQFNRRLGPSSCREGGTATQNSLDGSCMAWAMVSSEGGEPSELFI